MSTKAPSKLSNFDDLEREFNKKISMGYDDDIEPSDQQTLNQLRRASSIFNQLANNEYPRFNQLQKRKLNSKKHHKKRHHKKFHYKDEKYRYM